MNYRQEQQQLNGIDWETKRSRVFQNPRLRNTPPCLPDFVAQKEGDVEFLWKSTKVLWEPV